MSILFQMTIDCIFVQDGKGEESPRSIEQRTSPRLKAPKPQPKKGKSKSKPKPKPKPKGRKRKVCESTTVRTHASSFGYPTKLFTYVQALTIRKNDAPKKAKPLCLCNHLYQSSMQVQLSHPISNLGNTTHWSDGLHTTWCNSCCMEKKCQSLDYELVCTLCKL